ncbi:uncharacterized protein LOC132296483 [Cornus florida]|uniref:uncharacterized protein LOC132296483 n=1 Tax=Cornus florida TaxID=4283 RepID=UPI00289E5F54|nr:uncharacterized protein LOC132296483 [Cornus florida]
MIQVRWCNCSAEDFARQIQEEQKMMGNDGLKILIYSLNQDSVAFMDEDDQVDALYQDLVAFMDEDDWVDARLGKDQFSDSDLQVRVVTEALVKGLASTDEACKASEDSGKGGFSSSVAEQTEDQKFKPKKRYQAPPSDRVTRDHYGSAVTWHLECAVGPKPFKFLKVWCFQQEVDDLVLKAWSELFGGNPLHKLQKKLRAVKSIIRDWNKKKGKVSEQVQVVREDLHMIQIDMLKDSMNHDLFAKEREELDREVIVEEIKRVVMAFSPDKAPGPDGFPARFFQKFWHIVGTDLINAIAFFFNATVMPMGINFTFLALIPKQNHGDKVENYRPIAVCNLSYKIIYKILANRLSVVLPNIVGLKQSTFINGRRIHDNILLVSDVIKNFGLKTTGLAMALKVDLRKAYDSIKLCNVVQKIGLLVSHAFYADDLFIIVKADISTAKTVDEVLKRFYKVELSSLYHWVFGFKIPWGYITALEKKFKHFLWNGKLDSRKMSQLKWSQVTLPYAEGGFNLRKISDIDFAAKVSICWDFLRNKETLWVYWMHARYLQHHNFWMVLPKPQDSSIWKQILDIRDFF